MTECGVDDPYEAMGRKWLGIGNIASQHWFCGLEPGGRERADWPQVWLQRFGAAEVIDGRMDANDPDHLRWFSSSSAGQPTWIPLIRTLLSFMGKLADDLACLTYQRERFAAADAEAAVLELSAYAAKNLGEESPRERYMPERIARIRELLAEHKPLFLLCYGATRRYDFEQIVGGAFDEHGFRISGRTVCAISMHPKPRFRPAQPPAYWVNLGIELRRRSDAIR